MQKNVKKEELCYQKIQRKFLNGLMAKNLFAQFLTAGKKVHFVHHGKPRFDKERKSELRQIFVFGLLAKPILERLAWGVKKKNAVQFKVHGTFSYFDSSGKRDFLLQ